MTTDKLAFRLKHDPATAKAKPIPKPQKSTASSKTAKVAQTDDSQALLAKIDYLERQIHENNRDITMLSENLTKVKEYYRQATEQYQAALNVERDKALFFEARCEAELHKLAQLEVKLQDMDLSLDQFLDMANYSAELESAAEEDHREIERLNKLLTIALGYQTGSNKRNQELVLLREQSAQIAELKAKLQDIAGPPHKPVASTDNATANQVKKSEAVAGKFV